MSFKLAKLQIEASMPLKNIKDSLDKAYKAEHRDAFYVAQREAYNVLFPTTREATTFEYEAEFAKGDSNIYDVTYPYFADGSRMYPYYKIEIDYSEDLTFKTYEEYRDEVLVTTVGVEATYDVDGITILTPEVLEVREAVRPYVPQLQADVDTLVNNNKELVDYKLIKLKNDTQNKLDALTDSYPKFEKDTFWIQELEARSWNIDNTVATPFIDGLILARGIDKQLMVDKIIANSDALKTYSSTLLGQYQASL
jgi:hypothetical protein